MGDEYDYSGEFSSLTPGQRSAAMRGYIKAAFKLGGLVILLGLIWMIWASMLFRGLTERSAMESSQAARHIVEGDGFTTSIIRPLSFYYFPLLENHPDLFNPPFMTLLKTGLFMVGGSNDRMVILSSGLGWMICGLLVFFMTRRLSGRRSLGALALALWCVNTAMGTYAVDGESVMWSAALLTATLWLLFRAWERAGLARRENWTRERARYERPAGLAFAAGLSASLLSLCEPVLAWCVWPPVIWFWWRWTNLTGLDSPAAKDKQRGPQPRRNVFPRSYRWLLVGAALAPALLTLAPWYAAFVSTQATPVLPGKLRSFMATINSNAWPGDSIFRYANPPTEQPLLSWFGRFREAMGQSLTEFLRIPDAYTYLLGLIPLIFFVAGLFVAVDASTRALRRGLLAPFILAMIAFSLWSVHARFLGVFVPVMLVVSVMVMHQVTLNRWPDRSRRKETTSRIRKLLPNTRRRKVLLLLLMLSAIPAIRLRMNLPPKTPLLLPPGLNYVIENGESTDVVLTDDPWSVAWYGDRLAVWLPQREYDLELMEKQGAKFDWIYLRNAPVSDPREIGDWWPALLTDPEGWREFKPPDRQFLRERVLKNRLSRSN
jgi:hypothetical protein